MEVRRRVRAATAVALTIVAATVVPALGAPPEDDGVPYPRQQPLTEPPVDEGDRSLDRGAVPFHDIAPQVNALMAGSPYVSAEVVGRSTQGRELYLLTVTAPESPRRAPSRTGGGTSSSTMPRQRCRTRSSGPRSRCARSRA